MKLKFLRIIALFLFFTFSFHQILFTQSNGLVTTYQYDPLMNRLLEDDTFTYTYDANGNLITKTVKLTSETTTYTYNSENQLIEVASDQGLVASYQYDGLGRRIIKTNHQSLATIHYIYDGEDILMEYASTSSAQAPQLTAYYTHGPGIDEPLSIARDLNNNNIFDSTEHFFYHADALGSITAITDSTGSLIESYQYDSFGNPTIYDSTDTVVPESLIDNSYLFTGREFDSESGLYYFRARYYDSRVGRFISEDPISGSPLNPSSFNPYVYVQNNPLIIVDPYGLRGTFKENFDFSVKTTNQFFFNGSTRLLRTAIGSFTGASVAKETGFRTLGMALKEYLYYQKTYAPSLGMAGATTIFQLGASVLSHAATNALLVGFSLEVGILGGSLIDALIQTFLVSEEQTFCEFKKPV